MRYEILPARSTEEKVLRHVPAEVPLAVTASPVKGLGPTLKLTTRLARHGYTMIPHVPARLIESEGHLDEIVGSLRAAGIRDVFVPAGDADRPAGRYDAALPLLRRIAELGGPFEHVGITGYPESHPRIDDDVTIQAMWDKRAFSTYIVSNLCFDARVLTAWLRRVRRRRVTLPVYVGVAGPVDRTKLLAVAVKIGVGESTRFLARHPSWFLRFAAPGGYVPERLLHPGAPVLTAPGMGVAGLHVFTFNQLAETESWRRAMLTRAGRP
ncbi:methylenetetrahydrofolate reductase [Streptomyces sp. NPDC054887]